MNKSIVLSLCMLAALGVRPLGALAQSSQPNILVIFTDAVGVWNISAYHRGMMGGSTPNIDRLAKDGALFTDYYAQQSCTAGRAAFITGQQPFRVGLLKVGLPGARQGLQAKDPTIAELLKAQGYVTGQTGKNHLGDRYEFLPTGHGFDEFYGNLYHLHSEEEPTGGRAANSSISTTTPALTRCATATGRSTSSGSRAISLPAPSRPPTCRSSSTGGKTPSSATHSNRISTGAGRPTSSGR